MADHSFFSEAVREYREATPFPAPEPPRPSIVATPFAWRDPSAIPPRRWLYGRHLIRGFISCTIAPGGVGKSSLEIADVLAMVTSRDLIGAKPPKAMRVWYINLEDPLEEMERRVLAVCLHHKISPEQIGGRLFLDSGRDQEIILATADRKGFTIIQPIVDAVVATIKENRIDALFVDPFVSSHRVSENDNGAIDAVAKTWAKIADLTGCAIDLVHHVRKTGGAEVTAEDARGASALVSAARSVRVLNPMTEEEAARAGVENRRTYFRVDCGKANLAPPPDKSDWFHLASVPLFNGPELFDGQETVRDEGDRVGVVEAWNWPNPLDTVSVADLRAVQEEVAAGRWRENTQSKNWVGYAVAKVLKLDPSRKSDKAKISALLKIWISTGMLVLVEGKDENRNTRTFVEVGTPAND